MTDIIDPQAMPPSVAPGELITSAWGNDVVASLQALDSFTRSLEAEMGRVHAWFKQVTTGAGPFGATPVDFPGLSVTVPFAPTVLYRATAFVPRVERTSSGIGKLFITNSTGGPWNQAWYSLADGQTFAMFCTVLIGGPTMTGSQEVKVQMSTTAGTLSAIAGPAALLSVEEISLSFTP